MSDFEKVYSVEFETRKAEAQLKRLDDNLEKIGKETKAVSKSFGRHVGQKAVASTKKLNKHLVRTKLNLTKLRGGLDSVSRKLAIVSGGFIALGGVSVRNVLKLNEGLANVSTLLSGGEKQIQGFKTGVQEMAKDTGKATDDLTDGLYEVVSALGEGTNNMRQLGVATRAAVAGRSDTLGSIKMLSAVTKGYGDTSEEAMMKVSDLAFQTVKLGQTTFPELAASMGKVVPLAAAMNTSQEELFGTMATLTGVTGGTAEVSTQLASIYSAFLKPTAKMTKAAQKYGFESGSAMMKTVGLRQSLINLNESVGGSEEGLAKLLKRKEALVGALALLGGQSDAYTYKLGEMQKAAGATDAAYKKQTEGINKQGHSWNQTKQRMVVFSQRLGDKLLPVLSKLMDKLEPVLKYIENMDEETMEAWMQAGKWAIQLAIATKALSGLLGVVQAIGSLRTMTQGLAGVTTGLGNVTGKANTAAGAMRGFKAAGVASALAVGLAIGTMLSDIFLEPAARREHNLVRDATDSDLSAEKVARHGTKEDIDRELGKIGQQRKKIKNTSGSFAGGIVAAVTGDFENSPGAKRGRAFKALDKSEQGLYKAHRDRTRVEAGMQSYADAFGQGGFTGAGSSSMFRESAPRQSVDNSIKVTINAPGGDADKIGRVVKREVKKAQRQQNRELEQTANGIAPGQR